MILRVRKGNSEGKLKTNVGQIEQLMYNLICIRNFDDFGPFETQKDINSVLSSTKIDTFRSLSDSGENFISKFECENILLLSQHFFRKFYSPANP